MCLFKKKTEVTTPQRTYAPDPYLVPPELQDFTRAVQLSKWREKRIKRFRHKVHKNL